MVCAIPRRLEMAQEKGLLMLDSRWKTGGFLGVKVESQHSQPKRNLRLRPVNTQMLGFIRIVHVFVFVFLGDSKTIPKKVTTEFRVLEERGPVCSIVESDQRCSTGMMERWSCTTFGPSCPRQKENGSF